MKKRLFLGLLLVLALFAVACSKDEKKEATNVERGHLNMALYWFGDTLDPALGWDGWTLTRVAVGETLVTLDENLNIVPQLADSWENVNETTWKFHIRQGVTFQNGNPLTAEAVKSSIERSIKMNERGKTNLKLKDIQVDGEYVIFTTEEPYGAFLANISEPLFIIVDTSVDTSKYAEAPIATGPYKVVSYKDKVSFELEAYDGYWGGKPALASVSVLNIGDDNTRALAVQSGDVDMAQGIRSGNVSLFEGNENYITKSTSGTRIQFLFMNTARPALANKNVRLAINSGINYDTFAKVAGGNSVAAAQPYPESTPYGKNLKKSTYDLDKAKDYLKAAGYVDTNADGYVDKDGKNLELNITSPASSAGGNSALNELLQAQLKEIGIKVNINLVENIDVVKANSDFDMLFTNWQTVSTGDSQWFLDQAFKTGASDNYGKYSNKELDDIINKLSVTFDTKERIELTRKAAQIIIDEGFGTYLISQANVNVSSKKVENMLVFPIDYYFLTPNVSITK